MRNPLKQFFLPTYKVPRVVLMRSAAQSIPNTTNTPVLWDLIVEETWPGMARGNATAGYTPTAPIDGVYIAEFNIETGGSGMRYTTLSMTNTGSGNPTSRSLSIPASTYAATENAVCTCTRMKAGDGFGVILFQNSGGAITLANIGGFAAGLASQCSLTWIGN